MNIVTNEGRGVFMGAFLLKLLELSLQAGVLTLGILLVRLIFMFSVGCCGGASGGAIFYRI